MRIARWSLPPVVLRVVQIAVAGGLLAIIWTVADGPEAADILMSADASWLLAAFAALTVQTVLSALRWRLTAAQLGIALGRRWAVQEYYMAQIVNQSLPGGMIGDAGRAVRAREQAGLLASGQAVVFERLAGQVAMFAVMALAFVATFVAPGGLEWPHWLVLPVSLMIAVALSVPALLVLAARMPGPIGRQSKAFCRTLGVAFAAPDVLPRQVALSIGTTFCNLSAFAFCAHAIGSGLSLVAVVAFVPLILFTMLIPISLSGWGLREGAAVALFPLAGATASEGLATSVAFGLTFLLSVLPGALPLMLGTAAPANRQ